MGVFSFDIVSEYDKAEMNNVVAQAQREVGNRYDFKGTQAAIEWLPNKTGIKLIGDNQFQVDALLDVVRKKIAARGQSSKVLDMTGTPHESNLRVMWELPFKEGLSKELAKQIAAQVRDISAKAKPQIQGEAVRVTSGSKDELQKVMAAMKNAEYDVPLSYTNFR